MVSKESKNREGQEEEEEEEKEEEEEEEKPSKPRYGTLDFYMELTLGMDSIMDHMDFVWDSRKVNEFQI